MLTRRNRPALRLPGLRCRLLRRLRCRGSLSLGEGRVAIAVELAEAVDQVLRDGLRAPGFGAVTDVVRKFGERDALVAISVGLREIEIAQWRARRLRLRGGRLVGGGRRV